jgi:hypothetical protein
MFVLNGGLRYQQCYTFGNRELVNYSVSYLVAWYLVILMNIVQPSHSIAVRQMKVSL